MKKLTQFFRINDLEDFILVFLSLAVLYHLVGVLFFNMEIQIVSFTLLSLSFIYVIFVIKYDKAEAEDFVDEMDKLFGEDEDN